MRRRLEFLDHLFPFLRPDQPEHPIKVPILPSIGLGSPFVPEGRLIKRKDDFAVVAPDDRAKQTVAKGNALIPSNNGKGKLQRGQHVYRVSRTTLL